MTVDEKGARRVAVADLAFAGLVRSEWVKLRSIRSSWWCLVALLGIIVGVPALSSSGLGFQGMDEEVSAGAAQSLAVYAVSVSTDFGVMIVSVLGVLLVAGEYGTGTMRTTLTVAPRRMSVLAAKAVVLGTVILVTGIVGIAAAAPVTWMSLRGNGVVVDPTDMQYWWALVRMVVFLVATGWIALGIGAVLRSVVGGITASVALMTAFPLLLGLLGGSSGAVSLQNLASVLPSRAGAAFLAYPSAQSWVDLQISVPEPGSWSFAADHGGLVLAAWVVVLGVAAAVLIRRRDA